MNTQTPAFDQPFVIARAEGALLAVPATWATEMFVCPTVTAVPMAPPYVRGVLVRRARTLSLIDARRRLGLVDRRAENAGLVELLHAREADHVRWIDTLVACISSGEPFPLARDPSACAFGKWFDNFVPPTVALKRQLSRFNEPHKAIHALATTAEDLASRDRAAALALIQREQSHTLTLMRTLFAETREQLCTDVQEIVIAHDSGHRLAGLIVDDIVSVERLRAESLVTLDGTVQGGDDPLVRFSARTAQDEVVLLPDLTALMGEATAR